MSKEQIQKTRITASNKLNFFWEQYKSLYLRDKIAFAIIPILLFSTLPFGLIYLGAYLWTGIKRRCPSCKVLYGRTVIDSEILNQHHGYETVVRRDEIRALTDDTLGNWMGGKHVGNVVRQEQVNVTYSTIQKYYECCDCDHQWSEIVESKST